MNFDKSGNIIKLRLVNFMGDLPKGDYVLGFGDYNYYLKWGERFVDSGLKQLHRVHLHIINPDGDFIKRDGLTITTSSLPVTKDYDAIITTQRCVVWKKLLQIVPYKFWSFDLDGYFNSQFSFDYKGIGIYLRHFDYANDLNRVVKSLNKLGWDVDMPLSYIAIFYITLIDITFIDIIISVIEKSKIAWGYDQGALYRAYCKCKDDYKFFQPGHFFININKTDHPCQHLYKFYHWKGNKGTRMSNRVLNGY